MKHAYFKMAVKFRLRQSGLSTQNVTETNYAGHFGLLPQAVLFSVVNYADRSGNGSFFEKV